MKNQIYLTVISLFIIGSLAGCGSDNSQTQQQQKKAQKEQQKQQQTVKDTVKKAETDTTAREEKEKDRQKQKKEKEDKLTLSDIDFNPNGNFSVQVEAWRSKDKAQERVSKWKKRGFSNAFVIKHGNEDTGDIWFRIRLGKVNSLSMAKKLSTFVKKNYNEKTWIVSSSTEA